MKVFSFGKHALVICRKDDHKLPGNLKGRTFHSGVILGNFPLMPVLLSRFRKRIFHLEKAAFLKKQVDKQEISCMVQKKEGIHTHKKQAKETIMDYKNYEEKLKTVDILLPTKLTDAVRNGNWDEMKQLLDQDVDINAQNEDGDTALHVAAKNGNLELCKYLIAQGADINAKNFEGEDTLFNAVGGGNPDVCKYLVEQGADVNGNNADYCPVLHVAAIHGNLDVCQYLVEQGADVHGEDDYEYTVLHYAAKGGSLEVCQYLVEQGVDVNAKSFECETVLHEAAEKGNLELCRYFMEHGADVNVKKENGDTALHVAAAKGNLELCQYLVEQGADVNAKIFMAIRFCLRQNGPVTRRFINGCWNTGGEERIKGIIEVHDAFRLSSPRICGAQENSLKSQARNNNKKIQQERKRYEQQHQ